MICFENREDSHGHAIGLLKESEPVGEGDDVTHQDAYSVVDSEEGICTFRDQGQFVKFLTDHVFEIYSFQKYEYLLLHELGVAETKSKKAG